MSFPRYPEYKDSGVKWLGEVPEHWEIKPIWALFKRTKRTGHESEQLLSVYRDYGVVPKSSRDDNNNKSSDDLSPYQLVRVGDLVINKMKAWQGSVAISEFQGIVSPAYFVYEAKHGEEPKYLHYLMRSLRYITGYLAFSKGIRVGQWDLEPQYHSRMPILIPPKVDQQKIVKLLDRETGKIDNLIIEQENLIALLEEKRQAVIAHAVSKGLDPAVPMKDSGIEWLGEVPAHWHVMPIRLAAKLESGHTPSRSRPEYWDDCYIPWMTLADVWQIRKGKADYIYETKETVSDLGLANSSARLLPKGTVVLSRTASVGFSAIMGVDMATTQDFANWVCGEKLIPEFLLFVFRSMEGEFRRLMMGSTHNTIYMPDIQAFRFVLPSLEEQEQIIKHCRRSAAEFDELIAEAQRGIDLLKERRTALISAAVTGQIDVRGLVNEEQEQAA